MVQAILLSLLFASNCKATPYPQNTKVQQVRIVSTGTLPSGIPFNTSAYVLDVNALNVTSSSNIAYTNVSNTFTSSQTIRGTGLDGANLKANTINTQVIFSSSPGNPNHDIFQITNAQGNARFRNYGMSNTAIVGGLDATVLASFQCNLPGTLGSQCGIFIIHGGSDGFGYDPVNTGSDIFLTGDRNVFFDDDTLYVTFGQTGFTAFGQGVFQSSMSSQGYSYFGGGQAAGALILGYGNEPVSYPYTGSISTFTSRGALFLASGSSLTLQGSGGVIITKSSVTASAYYGYGGNLTGITAAGDNLGNHIATKTITAGYGIAATTGVFTAPSGWPAIIAQGDIDGATGALDPILWKNNSGLVLGALGGFANWGMFSQIGDATDAGGGCEVGEWNLLDRNRTVFGADKRVITFQGRNQGCHNDDSTPYDLSISQAGFPRTVTFDVTDARTGFNMDSGHPLSTVEINGGLGIGGYYTSSSGGLVVAPTGGIGVTGDINIGTSGTTNGIYFLNSAGTNNVYVNNDGAGNMSLGATAISINAPTTVNGKLTVTGAIDPPSVSLSAGAGTDLWYESGDGQGASTAASGKGRIRYNNSTKTWQTSVDGQAYTSISTAPTTTVRIDSTVLSGNVGASTLYAVPSVTTGTFRVSGYIVCTSSDSISSTMPNLQIIYQDPDSGKSITLDVTPVLAVANIGQTNTLTANQVGNVFSGVVPINVGGGNTIQYKTVNYTSGGNGTMRYALHIVLEKL